MFSSPPTFEHEYIRIYVLHLKPAGESQGGVRPHPIHQSSQLQQEGDQQEPSNNTQWINNLKIYIIIL